MKREELKDLGLSDEQVGSIMAMHSSEMNKLRGDLTSVEQERDTMSEQLKSNQEELSKMKESVKDNEELKTRFDELQDKYDESKKNSENTLNRVRKDSAIDMALLKAQARNPKAIKALLDDEVIKLDDDGLHGLNEQIDKLKESDGYLFEKDNSSEKKPGINATTGGNPSDGKPDNESSVIANALGLKSKN